MGGDVSYVQGRQLSFGFLIGKGKTYDFDLEPDDSTMGS